MLWLPVFILMMTSTPSQEVIGEIALGRLVSLVILLDDFRQVGHTNAPTTPKGIQSSNVMEAAVTFVRSGPVTNCIFRLAWRWGGRDSKAMGSFWLFGPQAVTFGQVG